MKPPSKEQLVGPPPLSLDEEWVLKNFLGKTVDQAREMCQHGPPVTEDFSYMTPTGLDYYLPAAWSYLESDDSTGDWEFAHGLMCSLSCQVGVFGLRGEPLVLINKIANYCDRHRAKFDFEPDDLLDEYLKSIRNAEPDAPQEQ